jgi:hypothetical protein
MCHAARKCALRSRSWAVAGVLLCWLVVPVGCGRSKPSGASPATGGGPGDTGSLGGTGGAGGEGGVMPGMASDAGPPSDGGGSGGSAAGGGAGDGPSLFIIDDMEFHPEKVTPPLPSTFSWGTPLDVHFGNWFVSWSDESGIRDVGISDIVPPRNESRHARELVRGDSVRDANLQVQLDHLGDRAINLTVFAGITFWARLTGGGGKLVVALDFSGVYFKSQAAGTSRLSAQTIDVTNDWKQFTLPFGTFGVEPRHVVSIDFIVAGDVESFDLWIDDLALVCRDACPGMVPFDSFLP